MNLCFLCVSLSTLNLIYGLISSIKKAESIFGIKKRLYTNREFAK